MRLSDQRAPSQREEEALADFSRTRCQKGCERQRLSSVPSVLREHVRKQRTVTCAAVFLKPSALQLHFVLI